MVWTVMNAFNTVGDTEGEVRHGRSMVNALADHIRSLGYVVECGYDLEYIYESFPARRVKRRERRKQSYVIVGIQNQEGDYVYGCPELPTEWGVLPVAVSYREQCEAYSSATCKWSEAELDEHWPLLRSHNPKLGDVSRRVNIKDDELAPLALSGELRTFGNTLPEDIVQVLKGYQGSETLSPWESEIPLPTACPCAEMEEGAEFEDGAEMEAGTEMEAGAEMEAVTGVATQVGYNSSSDDDD